MFKTQNLLYVVIGAVLIMYLLPRLFNVSIEGMCGCGSKENFDGGSTSAGSGHQHAPDCGGDDCDCGPYSGSVYTGEPENFSSCYRRKQIYLSSCDPDAPTAHADVNLEKRWGKLYITINANLPFALGGVFNTMWGAYHAWIVDTRTKRSINLGSLVRHGDRFYKLSTELLGEYGNYNEIWVYRQSEDYASKLTLRGSVNSQCTSM